MEDRAFFPIAVFIVLLGAIFPLYGVETYHGPYPYTGVNPNGYSDPQSALYACKQYMDSEAPNFHCHDFPRAFNPAEPTHQAAIGLCAGANPVQAWVYNSGGPAGLRFFWACALGGSGSCPAPMQWGYGPDGACGYPPQSECTPGDPQRFHGDAGEPIPENVCSNGCWYEAQFDDVPVTFNMQGTAWSGNFISTGNQCDLLQGESGGGGPPENCIADNYGNTFCVGLGPGNAPPNCMEANGDQACLDAYDPLNCGYINGEQVCFEDYPDEGTCEFLPGGSYICFSGDQTPQSPPYPDTGTPGEPATPDVQMQKGDGQGGAGHTLDYFNSNTVDQSSGEGGSPGPNSDKSTPDKMELDGPLEVELKEPVKIDEEGTPQQSATDQTIFDEIFDQTGINDLEAEIADIGAGTVSPIPDVPATLSDIDELFPTPQSCADPQLSFAGFSMVIPFSTMGQGLRDVLGWAFYIMTGLYLFGLVMSLPSKVK